MEALATDFDVKVFGVQAAAGAPFDDTPAGLAAFREQTGVTFPFLLESPATTYQAYRMGADDDTTPYPLDVVIDRNGIVRYLRGEYDDAAVRDVLDAWCN
jgi:peroxiredoxin